MVLYFSGTGNSEYVAKRIAKALDEEIINLFEKIRDNDHSVIESDRPFILVAPTYCYKVPIIVEEWLKKTTLKGNRDMYFVLTCGSGIGGAGHFAKLLAESIGMTYKGIAKIVMPENYIAMFSAPKEDVALKIIDKSETVIDKTIDRITNGELLTDDSGPLGILFTRFLVWVFYKYFVHDKKYYVKDNCVGCGICAKKCVNSNITIEEGKPMWHGNCTQCMACMNYCPKEAVEYGKHSVGQPRYVCPKDI